jgi:hypothetical protein
MTAFLEPAMADRLGAMHGPGESYSDVILRASDGDDADANEADWRMTATHPSTAHGSLLSGRSVTSAISNRLSKRSTTNGVSPTENQWVWSRRVQLDAQRA